MKRMVKFLFPLFIALFLIGYSNNVYAQPCDTCTSTWSANTTVTFTFSLPSVPGCTYKGLITYRTRVCNGYTQIDIVSHFFTNTPYSSGCSLHCIHAPALRKAMYNYLLNLLGAGAGTTVVVAEPSPCYYTGWIIVPPGADVCYGFTPGDTAYLTMPCDEHGCCYKELTPVGTSTYYQTVINSTPCPPVPYIPSSTTIQWACDILGGGSTSFNVVFHPDSPLVCQMTCFDGYAKTTGFKKVEESSTISTLKAYPNPVSDEVNVRFYSTKAAQVAIDIVDVAGKVVVHKDYTTVAGMQQVSISTSVLVSGIYTLRISNGEEERTTKIVK